MKCPFQNCITNVHIHIMSERIKELKIKIWVYEEFLINNGYDIENLDLSDIMNYFNTVV